VATKTITCVANGLKFEDPTGVQHTVTTSQTFTFDLTDGGASAVAYRQNNATSVTTTDGRTLVFRPQATMSQPGAATFNGTIGVWGPTADAQDGLAVVGLAGEFVTEFSEGGVDQYWKSETLTVDNIDAPTLISGRWKDQYGRYMDWTALTVA
jgi:hypothetical protein